MPIIVRTRLGCRLAPTDEPTSETTDDICIRWSAPLAYVAAYLQLTESRSTRT